MNDPCRITPYRSPMLNRRSFLRWSLSWPLSVPLIGSAALLRAADETTGLRDETLTKGRPTDVESLADAIVIKNENVFFVARSDGSVPLKNSHGLGLYYHDCRYLNGYEIELNGKPPAPLSASSAQGSMGVFTLTNPKIELPDGGVVEKEELGITWRRLIDSETPALRERLEFQNFTLQLVQFPVTLRIQSAFEDLFAVRGLLPKQFGTLHPPSWEGDVLRLFYEGKDGIYRSLMVHFDPLPGTRNGTTAEFMIRLKPRGRTQLDLALVIEESTKRPARPAKPDPVDLARLESTLEEETRAWIGHVTKVSSNGSALDQLIERSFRGLRILRTHVGDETYFAAGGPGSSPCSAATVSSRRGKCSRMIQIAEQTLRLLAKYQGTKEDDWRDEQPGKILHELRVGEMANLGAIPHTPFYGTVDATPLFLMLLSQHAA